MRTVIVTFANGNTITTGINGTEQEIREYYAVGRVFNIGNGENDDMQPVTALAFLLPILGRVDGNLSTYVLVSNHSPDSWLTMNVDADLIPRTDGYHIEQWDYENTSIGDKLKKRTPIKVS